VMTSMARFGDGSGKSKIISTGDICSAVEKSISCAFSS